MYEEYALFVLNMATLNSFILFTKYTTHQNQNEKSYAFKDFTLDCVWEMREPGKREDEKNSADNKSLPSTSTAPVPTPPACK
jgi:hypothetical protein